MFEKVGSEGWSGKKVYQWLRNEAKFTSVNNKPLTLSNVYMTLKNTLYYGVFEYPKGGGQWYTGIHQPIITKELYEKVQKQLKRSEIENPWGSKEFAFTKLIACGYCGAAITADEKLKKLKGGGVNRHVYYSCSKRWQKDCKCGYIKEGELVEQLMGVIDTVKLDRTGIREKLESEINRYHKFRSGVLRIKEKDGEKSKDVDIRNYAKYILKEGAIFEKRELLSCMRSRLVLKNKELYLRE